MKNINETRDYLTEEIKKIELISKKQKRLLILVSMVTRCISLWLLDAFASLVSIPVCRASSAVRFNFFAINARIKKYKSILRRRRRRRRRNLIK